MTLSNEIIKINVISGKMERIEYTGDVPLERKNSCMTQIGDNFFIFGGYSQRYLDDIHIFNLS